MKKRFFAVLFPTIALACTALAARYDLVQTVPTLSAAEGSRYVTLEVHLHNTGSIAAGCIVKASGQTRVTGVSAHGDAQVVFDLRTYKGYTVTCRAN